MRTCTGATHLLHASRSDYTPQLHVVSAAGVVLHTPPALSTRQAWFCRVFSRAANPYYPFVPRPPTARSHVAAGATCCNDAVHYPHVIAYKSACFFHCARLCPAAWLGRRLQNVSFGVMVGLGASGCVDRSSQTTTVRARDMDSAVESWTQRHPRCVGGNGGMLLELQLASAVLGILLVTFLFVFIACMHHARHHVPCQ